MKITLQNGWTRESLKARIVERVPECSRCVDGTGFCIYYNPSTEKSCAVGSLMPLEDAAKSVSVEDGACGLIENTPQGERLWEAGPFRTKDQYMDFQSVHDGYGVYPKRPSSSLHDHLCGWIDTHCEDPA